MRRFGQLIGWLLVLAALAVLGYGALQRWDTGRFELVSAGQLWFDLHKESLQLLEPALVRHVWEPLWDPVMLTLLTWPAAAVLGVPGLALVVLCWRRGARARRTRWH